MATRRDDIRDTLRRRIGRAIDAGALHGGDRLPSTRELAAELAADPRVIAAAYKQLAEEGLVDLRPRSGVFLAGPLGVAPDRALPHGWLADIVAGSVLRGVAAAELAGRLSAAVSAREVRAVVVAATADQAEGLAREIGDLLGMTVSAVLADALRAGESPPRAIVRAHVIVTTETNERRIRPLAERLGRRLIVIRVRSDLVAREYQAALARAAYVVVADERFATVLRDFLASAPGGANARILVHGRDDLAEVPDGAITYVTQAARARLGRTRLPGRVLPPARTLADDCVRELARVLVEVNLGGG